MTRLTSVPIQGRWVGFSTHRRRASLLTRCVCVAALNLAASVASAAGAAAREPRRVAAASRVTGRLSPLHMQLVPLIASELSLPTMYYFLYTRSCSASAVAFRSDDRRSWTSDAVKARNSSTAHNLCTAVCATCLLPHARAEGACVDDSRLRETVVLSRTC